MCKLCVAVVCSKEGLGPPEPPLDPALPGVLYAACITIDLSVSRTSVTSVIIMDFFGKALLVASFLFSQRQVLGECTYVTDVCT